MIVILYTTGIKSPEYDALFVPSKKFVRFLAPGHSVSVPIVHSHNITAN